MEPVKKLFKENRTTIWTRHTGLTRARAHAKPCGILHERLAGRFASSIACEMSGCWPTARWAMIRKPFSLLPKWVLCVAATWISRNHSIIVQRSTVSGIRDFINPRTDHSLPASCCRAKGISLHRVALESSAYLARDCCESLKQGLERRTRDASQPARPSFPLTITKNTSAFFWA